MPQKHLIYQHRASFSHPHQINYRNLAKENEPGWSHIIPVLQNLRSSAAHTFSYQNMNIQICTHFIQRWITVNCDTKRMCGKNFNLIVLPMPVISMIASFWLWRSFVYDFSVLFPETTVYDKWSKTLCFFHDSHTLHRYAIVIWAAFCNQRDVSFAAHICIAIHNAKCQSSKRNTLKLNKIPIFSPKSLFVRRIAP